MNIDLYMILQNIMSKERLSIAELARKCDLPDSTVRGIMTRKQKSTALDVAFKLSKGLNVSLEHLNGNENIQNEVTEINNNSTTETIREQQLPFELNHHETTVITAYHNQPEMQPAVDRILCVEKQMLETAEELSPSNEEIEKELAAYRLELEAEQKGKTLSASTNINNIKKAN